MGGSDHCSLLTFLEAVTTVNVLKKWRNLNCAFRRMTIKILIVLNLFENIQTRPRLLLLANFILVLPLKYHVIFIFTFIPSIFERVQMAAIVDKVCSHLIAAQL